MIGLAVTSRAMASFLDQAMPPGVTADVEASSHCTPNANATREAI